MTTETNPTLSKWQRAPKGVSETIHANDQFFYDWSDFITYCVDNDFEPANTEPWVCELQRMPAPNLADLLQNDFDGNTDWHAEDDDYANAVPDVSTLQPLLDALYAEHGRQLYFATNTAFDLEEPTFVKWYTEALLDAASQSDTTLVPETNV